MFLLPKTSNKGTYRDLWLPKTWIAVAGVPPGVSPEEQYRFALGAAIDDDLASAEKAFAEFYR